MFFHSLQFVTKRIITAFFKKRERERVDKRTQIVMKSCFDWVENNSGVVCNMQAELPSFARINLPRRRWSFHLKI